MKLTASKFFVILAYMLLMLSSLLVLYKPITKIQLDLTTVLSSYIEQENLLTKLSEQIGYGGFIHNFKNYVIRREQHYLAETISLIEPTENTLQQLLVNSTDVEFQHEVKKIAETFGTYKQKALWMNENKQRVADLSHAELDRLVKVDDTLAIAALHRLRTHSKNIVVAYKAYTEHHIVKYKEQMLTWWLLISVVYWLTVIVILVLRNKTED